MYFGLPTRLGAAKAAVSDHMEMIGSGRQRCQNDERYLKKHWYVYRDNSVYTHKQKHTGNWNY